MSLKDMDGKTVNKIFFSSKDQDYISNTADRGGNCLRFEVSYEGDRYEYYVLELDSANNEKARHNIRFIETIEWL